MATSSELYQLSRVIEPLHGVSFITRQFGLGKSNPE
jgi:hypothetical protein